MKPEQRLTPAQYRALEEVEAGRVGWSMTGDRFFSTVFPPATRVDAVESLWEKCLVARPFDRELVVLTDEGCEALAQHRSPALNDLRLTDFVRESNRIEGINRDPMAEEVEAHLVFLGRSRISVGDLEQFVQVVAGRGLRERVGMNVHVGGHFPPPGGPGIRFELEQLLARLQDGVYGPAWTPYELHQQYERLHPFMDGNGRSGRVLWAWHRQQIGRDPFVLGFLHSFYYEALASWRPCA